MIIIIIIKSYFNIIPPYYNTIIWYLIPTDINNLNWYYKKYNEYIHCIVHTIPYILYWWWRRSFSSSSINRSNSKWIITNNKISYSYICDYGSSGLIVCAITGYNYSIICYTLFLLLVCPSDSCWTNITWINSYITNSYWGTCIVS